MKSPPTSAPPDSPALLYLLALCDPGGQKDDNHHHHHRYHHRYHHHNNNNNNNNSHYYSDDDSDDSDDSDYSDDDSNCNNTKDRDSYYTTYSNYFASMDGLNKINPFSSSSGGGSSGKKGRGYSDMSIDELIQELRRQLPELLTRFHHFMLRAHKLMSTPGGIDKVLMTLSYTLQLLAPQLPPSSPLPASFRALTSLISDIRIFHRLWGLLGIYSWGHSIVQHPPRDLTIRRIVAAQVLANAAFQALENVAYLAGHGVVKMGKRGQGRLWVWSSRFWMAHVGLEFWRLQRVREMRVEKARRGVMGRGDGEEVGRWRRELVANCAYAPLTLHWSVEKGMIGPSAVGALGSVAAVIGLQNAWAATA